jgi:hypothetical protein
LIVSPVQRRDSLAHGRIPSMDERYRQVLQMRAYGYLPIEERRRLAEHALRDVIAPAAQALFGDAAALHAGARRSTATASN